MRIIMPPAPFSPCVPTYIGTKWRRTRGHVALNWGVVHSVRSQFSPSERLPPPPRKKVSPSKGSEVNPICTVLGLCVRAFIGLRTNVAASAAAA